MKREQQATPSGTASPSERPQSRSGSAWLVEFHAGPTLWFAGTFRKEGRRKIANFVPDANAAVRYPSQEAAELALFVLLDMRPRVMLDATCYRATEHEWVAPVSERGDSTRLDYLAKTLHIDATGDEPIYALFIPGTEGVKSKSDLRGLIDESMQLSGERPDDAS